MKDITMLESDMYIYVMMEPIVMTLCLTVATQS